MRSSKQSCDVAAAADPVPRVSIVIPTLGNALIVPCLASIRRHVPADLAYEVVVLANGLSGDRAAAIDAVGWPALRVLHTAVNVGFGAACNRAAAAARGEYLVFLNDDTEVLPGWLEALVTTADRHPRAAAVGSLILFPDGSIQEAGSVVWRDASTSGVGRGVAADGFAGFLRRVDYCSACSLLVRRQPFEAVGGFDGRYYPAYYEDVDLCFAFARDGFDVLFEPRSRLVHHESVSSSTPRKTHLVLRHREVFRQKWAGVLDRLDPVPVAADDTVLSRAVERARGEHHLLFIDDRPPQRGCGAGFAVLLDAIDELQGTGCAITVACSAKLDGDLDELAALGVQVMRDPPDAVLAAKAGEFDRVLISRPHNFERYASLVRSHQPQASLVYLVEALFYRRMQRTLQLTPESPERTALTAEMIQSRDMERGIPCLADQVVCVSDEEAAILAAVPGGCPIEVVRPIERRLTPTTTGFEGRSGLLFTPGWLAGDGSPNVDALAWFVGEVLPILRRSRPEMRLRVTGANPPLPVMQLAGDAVELLGYVPDLRSLYETARVVIVPMRVGSGVKVKCLEAVQYGVPVVSTPVGAEGLSLRDPRAVVVASDAVAFADAVLELHESVEVWTRQRTRVLGVAEAWQAQPDRSWRHALVPPARKVMHDAH